MLYKHSSSDLQLFGKFSITAYYSHIVQTEVRLTPTVWLMLA